MLPAFETGVLALENSSSPCGVLNRKNRNFKRGNYIQDIKSNRLAGFDEKQIIFEGDFCEFNCALIPAAVFQEVGLLDESYQNGYEEIEFCYRLYLKKYRAVYVQLAQISCAKNIVFTSAVAEESAIQENKKRFAEKYLKYGVSYPVPGIGVDSWAIINTYVYDYLKRYGLYRARTILC